MCYFICLLLGWVDQFQTVLWKMGLAFGGRVLSFAFLKLGLAGGLALAIGCILRALFSAEEMPHFMLPSGADASSSSNPQEQQPAANPAAEEPSRGWTSRFWDKFTSCLNPQTQDGGDSISPPEPTISNWIEDVDLPQESPSDTIGDLRNKCAILMESFSKSQSRDPFTWQDIAQRLALEGKETTAEVGATREDFQRLLGELQNPESDVYLRVLKALEKHPR